MPRHRPIVSIAIMASCLLTICGIPAADAFRLATWNMLNYPGAQGAAREPHFRTVLASVHPDVLVVQEMQSQTGVNQFLANVLEPIEPGQWAAGPFVNGPDTDNALFYRISAVTFVSHTEIPTDLRNISEYRVRLAGYSSAGGELVMYSTHLKAGSTSSDQDRRLSETTTWRNHMNTLAAGAAFAACGDFNIRASSEASYQKLLENQADNDGRCHDPIETPGTWYNNATFAAIHTQSTRTGQLSDGGASGGMDDRFDFMLLSSGFDDGEGLSYIPGTYTCFGQDGQHFNNNINSPPTNLIVGQTIADALYSASDHMPVIADFQAPAKAVAPALLAFGTVIVGASAVEPLSVENGAAVPADELNYSLSAPAGFTAPAGSFTALAGAGANAHDITMSTAASGGLSGALLVTSNDVDAPVSPVPVSGTVLDHAVPSLAAESVVTAGAADFGVHAQGGFSDQSVSVHNVGFDTYQAPAEVYAGEISGDARFSFAGGFSPEIADADPAVYAVHFDDAGAADGVYTGTLTLHTRDPQGIPGGTNLSDMIVSLRAEVDGAAVGIETGRVVAATRLYPASPNPLRWPALVRYDLAESGNVTVQVFDVRGRMLRTLVDRAAPAGRHTVTWDGRDASGRALGSGVYYVRMRTAHQIEMHPAVVMR